ncbi:MAG TPA: hypothetical protein VLN57_08625 [Xanthobacteraceae bacterium]|nr:hypothetical protein [Xanthobacteraceae bacterium]
MPGILAIIEDVAADPEVESSVGKLLSGLIGHLKDALATNNSAAVAEAANQIVEHKEALSAAVTANTPVAPGATEAGPTTEATGEDHHDGDAA